MVINCDLNEVSFGVCVAFKVTASKKKLTRVLVDFCNFGVVSLVMRVVSLTILQATLQKKNPNIIPP